MLKPNATKVAQTISVADAVAAFKSKGGEITRAEHPGVGAGIKRRKYLVGKGIYGVKPKVTPSAA